MKSSGIDHQSCFLYYGEFEEDYMMPSFGERPSCDGLNEREESSLHHTVSDQPVVADDTEITATVKWFNANKGFGFVELSDGSGDVFLHANTLAQTKWNRVSSGMTLVVQVGQGPKGRQVVNVISVDESTAQPEQTRSTRHGLHQTREPRPAPDMSNVQDVRGEVKWYNPSKGFGFIAPEDGSRDIFIHISILEHAGINNLREGQVVGVKVAQGQKGPEAVELLVD